MRCMPPCELQVVRKERRNALGVIQWFRQFMHAVASVLPVTRTPDICGTNTQCTWANGTHTHKCGCGIQLNRATCAFVTMAIC
ncbi:hypothetical protein M404DRAFT_320274 [Pisolithus tinctorius Marx 270]|uniref:Uncharacterized protein n=1 Tax=Pisolithus tinctorius Marx 270 TaxID=870435 RepID=A0A0C3NIZ5_PISTI|nr:hypothetical protein M404DRAFT_320274 [Pisolithus tinctorius Marx 270]